MNRRAARRGQPLVAFVALLVAWAGARAVLWQPLAALHPEIAAEPLAPGARPASLAPTAQRAPASAESAPAAAMPDSAPQPVAAPSPSPMPQWPLAASPAPTPLPPRPTAREPRLPVAVAAGHQLLWLAAVAQLPVPRFPALAAPRIAPARSAITSRWSGDAWLLLRGGSGAIGPAAFAAPAYGASQAGAVLRYSLAPGHPLRPTAYLRASAALRAPREREAAIGIALRPLAGLPVAALAELRTTQGSAGTALRPAASLVSEFAPLPLPLGARAEVYAQAGYVGGRDATAFADGQLRVTRTIAENGRLRLDLGGGAWGGVQKGASRLDVGPSAVLALPLGRGGARVAADWRVRVAGAATPGSGPAVTISAGF